MPTQKTYKVTETLQINEKHILFQFLYVSSRRCLHSYKNCFFLIDTFLITGGCYAQKTHNAIETLQINEKHILFPFLYVSSRRCLHSYKNCTYTVYVRKYCSFIDTFLYTGGCYAQKTHNATETLQINQSNVFVCIEKKLTTFPCIV